MLKKPKTTINEIIYPSQHIYICVMQAEQRYKSKQKKFGVLPIRIIKSNVSSVGSSSERNRKPCFSLTKGQRSKRQTLFVSAVHQPFYISICISTLPTQHTTFICVDISQGKRKFGNNSDGRAIYVSVIIEESE